MAEDTLYKVPLRLIDVSNWATVKMLWAVCRQFVKGGQYRMVRITEDESSVAGCAAVVDPDFGNLPLVFYFCSDCGNPLNVLFSGCICGGRYKFAIPGDAHEVLAVLDRNLPSEIIRAHKCDAYQGFNSRNRYEWKAPQDLTLQPGFKWP